MATWEDLQHDILIIITVALVILLILGLVQGPEGIEEEEIIVP